MHVNQTQLQRNGACAADCTIVLRVRASQKGDSRYSRSVLAGFSQFEQAVALRTAVPTLRVWSCGIVSKRHVIILGVPTAAAPQRGRALEGAEYVLPPLEISLAA